MAVDGPSEEMIGQDHGEKQNANWQNPKGLTIATQRHKPNCRTGIANAHHDSMSMLAELLQAKGQALVPA